MVAGHGEALAIVQKQKGLNVTHVFSLRCKPIVQVSTKARYGALKERESKISVGMIYATPERTDTYSAVRPPLFALHVLGGWESSEKFAGMRIS